MMMVPPSLLLAIPIAVLAILRFRSSQGRDCLYSRKRSSRPSWMRATISSGSAKIHSFATATAANPPELYVPLHLVPMRDSRFTVLLGTLDIEREQVLEYLFIREVGRPPVGGEDRFIERPVHVL